METEIFYGDSSVGFLRSERRGLYVAFYGEVSVCLLSKLYAGFEGGECSLGVPVPRGSGMVLRASVPASRLPKGQLQYASLRALEEQWENYPGGEIAGVKLPAGKRSGDEFLFPWKDEEPLPADAYLCFYEPKVINETGYLALRLNQQGIPTTKIKEE